MEAEAFFFDNCDDHITFAAVGMKCTWREGGGGIESDMRLVMEEIGKVAVDFRELFPSIEGQDVIGGVGGRGLRSSGKFSSNFPGIQ